jgi:hypothetical protein
LYDWIGCIAGYFGLLIEELDLPILKECVLDFNVASSKTGGTAHSKEASTLGIMSVSPLSSVTGWRMFRLLITGASCFDHLVIHV